MPIEKLKEHAVKVPEVTLAFWIIKILATTLGETAGDALTMSMNLGYLVGTALGDWMADTANLGYLGAAAIFAVLLAVVAAAYFFTRIARAALFWCAFVLTRPLGAVIGDFIDKPVVNRGLEFSRYSASAL